MAETATLDQTIPEGFVLSRLLDLYLTNKGLPNSQTVERLAQKLGIEYHVNKGNKITRINYRNSLRLVHALGLELLSHREFLIYRNESGIKGDFFSWVSDIYNFDIHREEIDVYLNSVSFDGKELLCLDANNEPIKPIRVRGTQARAIRRGYLKYIFVYDENGIPLEISDTPNRDIYGDKLIVCPRGIRATLRGSKYYQERGKEQILCLRNIYDKKDSKNKNGFRLYAKMPKQN